MKFVSVLMTIQNGLKTEHEMKVFMEKGIVDLMANLGDSEFLEAQRSFIWSRTGTDSRMHIENAATMFRLAKSKYINAIQSTTSVKSIFESFLGGWNSTSPLDYPRMINYKKACVCSILTATCYGYLREAEALRDSLADAEEIFKAYMLISSKEISSILLENTEEYKRQLEEDYKIFTGVVNQIQALGSKINHSSHTYPKQTKRLDNHQS